jgi:hypothetical protein
MFKNTGSVQCAPDLKQRERTTKRSTEDAVCVSQISSWLVVGVGSKQTDYRNGIFKLLRSPGIDTEESIPTTFVARRYF